MKSVIFPNHFSASVAVIASLFAFTHGQAATVGINFVYIADPDVQNGTGDALLTSEVAGVPAYAQANWNNYGRWGGVNNPINSNGSASGLSVAWDSQNTYFTNVGNGTPNNKLMNGYLDSNGAANSAVANPYSIYGATSNQPAVSVSGLTSWLSAQGASSYSVILYMDGDATSGRIGEYWLQNATGAAGALTVGTDLTSHIFYSDTANFNGTFIQATATSSGTAVYGNYIVFSGLTADSFLTRNDDPVRAPISGMQIIAVPETGAMMLLGLMILTGTLHRKRISE